MKRLLLTLAVLPAFYTAQITTFVSGGQEAHIKDVPHQVSLQVLGINNCGGSIIGNRWILTAAHCFKDPIMASITTVKAGITKLDTPISTTREYQIKRVIKHPNYNGITEENDIALLELTRNIEFNSNTKIISLGEYSYLYDIGRKAKVSGWGLPHPGMETGSNELRIVEVPIMKNSEAQVNYARTITGGMMATSPFSNDRKGACEGDSGGALITKDLDGEVKQIGIVSWGTQQCLGGIHSPTIYTKVANYIDWIKQYVPIGIKIQGSSVLCGGDTETYTVDNPNGDPITWQLSGGIWEVGRTENSITIRGNTNGGLATIKASNGTREVSQKVWVGKPQVHIVKGGGILVSYATVESEVAGARVEDQGVYIDNITWNRMGYHPATGIHYQYSPKESPEPRELGVIVPNKCGDVVKVVTFNPCQESYNIGMLGTTYELGYNNPCDNSGGWDNGGGYYPFRSATRVAKALPSGITIQVANAMGQVVLTTQSKTFSLANALPGTYYARVMKNGQVVHTQTLIKR